MRVNNPYRDNRISDSESADLLEKLRQYDGFHQEIMGKVEDNFLDKVDGDDYTEDDAYDDTIDVLLRMIKDDPRRFRKMLDELRQEEPDNFANEL